MNAERCVITTCGWWLAGTANDPEQPPRWSLCHMRELGSDRRCAATWMASQSWDDEDEHDTYDQWLAAL